MELQLAFVMVFLTSVLLVTISLLLHTNTKMDEEIERLTESIEKNKKRFDALVAQKNPFESERAKTQSNIEESLNKIDALIKKAA